MAYFVCLDTSVLVELFQQICAGKKAEGWNDLKSLIDAGDATLVVPEITILEFKKERKEALACLSPEVDRAVKAVSDATLKSHLTDSLQKWREQREKEIRDEADKIIEWLTSKAFIPFTDAITHATRRRLIAAEYPQSYDPDPQDNSKEAQHLRSKQAQWLRDQDCSIIDSLISYFGGDLNDKTLIFGTLDGGFGKLNNGSGSLDRTFQDGLPPAHLFTNVAVLVEFVKSNGAVNQLPEKAKQEKQEAKIEQTIEQSSPAETIVSVPVGGGKVVEVHVRDGMCFSDTTITSTTTSTTTTPPPVMYEDDWYQSQRRANEMTLLRHMDDQRRRRNAENYELPPSFFAPPEVKVAQIRPDQVRSIAGNSGRRWVDPQGIAWQMTFEHFAPSFDHLTPMGSDESLPVVVTLDRRKTQNCREDVSPECAEVLKTLDFRPAMERKPKTITLLEKNGDGSGGGGYRVEAGSVEILRFPVTKPEDYRSQPRDILTFEQVKELASHVGTLALGTIGDYDWQS